jgi:hypothetical protein
VREIEEMQNKERYADSVYAFIQKKRFFKRLQANMEYVDCTLKYLKKIRENYLKRVWIYY